MSRVCPVELKFDYTIERAKESIICFLIYFKNSVLKVTLIPLKSLNFHLFPMMSIYFWKTARQNPSCHGQ